MKKEKYIYEEEEKIRVRIRKRDKVYSKYFYYNHYPTKQLCKQEAIKDRDRVLFEIQMNMYTDNTKKTVHDVYNESFTLFPVCVTTKKRYDNVFKSHLLPLSNIYITKLTAKDIMTCIAPMADKNKPSEINHTFTVINRIIHTARAQRYIIVNIIDEIKAPKSKVVIQPRQVTTDHETIEKIIKDLDNSRGHDLKMISKAIRLMWTTGIRPAECFALLRRNIDLKTKTIHITHQKGSNTNTENILTPTKTYLSNRIVPITDEIAAMLKDLLNSHTSDFVFPSRKGTMISSYTYQIYQFSKKRGYTFNLYMLRHTFSTDLILSGTDLRTVQELMGHKDISMSVYYARSNEEAKRKAIEKRSSLEEKTSHDQNKE